MPGGPSYDYGFYSRLSKFIKRVIGIVGASRTVNSQTVIVEMEDGDGYITRCRGTVTITDAGAGYAKGCLYTKTDGSAGGILYVNEGTSSSCDFNVVSPVGSQNAFRVIAAGLFTTVGGDANEAITVTGALSTDVVAVTLRVVGGTPRTIITAIPATNAINVVMSGDPSTTHVLQYVVLRSNA